MSTYKPMGDGMTLLAGLILPFAAIFVIGFAYRFVADHPWWALFIVVGVPIIACIGFMVRVVVVSEADLRAGPQFPGLDDGVFPAWQKGRSPEDVDAEPEPRRPRLVVIPVLSFPDVAPGGGVLRWIERPDPASSPSEREFVTGPMTPPADAVWLGTGGYFHIVHADPASGDFDVVVRVEPPDAKQHDAPPTSAQIEYYRSFMGEPPPDLTFSQVSGILSCIAYARAIVADLPLELSRAYEKALTSIVAAFVASSTVIAADVRKWNDRRWRSGADHINIRMTKHFIPVHAETLRVVEILNARLALPR